MFVLGIISGARYKDRLWIVDFATNNMRYSLRENSMSAHANLPLDIF